MQSSLVTEGDILVACAQHLRQCKRPTVLDVGAYVGKTVGLWLGANPRAMVHAFEPDAANFAELELQYRCDVRIHCHQVAIWKWDGNKTLYTANHEGSQGSSQGNSMYASMMAGKKWARHVAKQRVWCCTLDSFVRAYNIRRIDLLKLNAEGAEYAIFEGGTQFLDITDLLYLCLHGKSQEFLSDTFRGKRNDIVAMLDARGFRMLGGVRDSQKHMPQLWARA